MHDSYSTDPNHRLRFSCDTLSFDTLFTTIPSRTMQFCIYNDNNKALLITEAGLRNRASSLFRYNFDGTIPDSSNTVKNKIIEAHDSLYVFVELTLSPNDSTMPIYTEDAFYCLCNGNRQELTLTAYGQDAVVWHHHSISSDTTLTSARPFLIFDYLHIPDNKTLTIEAGTHLYFHNGAHLVADGNLIVNGTAENPVVMRGDRFDAINDVAHTPYAYLPAQWGNIYLQNAHGMYILKHTQIRCGNEGILLLGSPRLSPTLNMDGCVIHNMSTYGLYAENGIVTITNCELSNCGTACIRQTGGQLHIAQSTLAAYSNNRDTAAAALILANYVFNGITRLFYPLTTANIENSIIFGNHSNEVRFYRDTLTNTAFNVAFNRCLIKAKQSADPAYMDVLWSHAGNEAAGHDVVDTVFVRTLYNDKGYYDFRLHVHSRARNCANIEVANLYPVDLNGHNRLADGQPDLGAYEYNNQ